MIRGRFSIELLMPIRTCIATFSDGSVRDANGSDVLVLALFADDHPCATR
jgi:hypothetical protein